MLYGLKKYFNAILRFYRHIEKDDAFGLAAETAFFFLLSFFPLMMLAGWALSYTDQTLAVLEGFLPADLLHTFEGVGESTPVANPVLIITTLWAASSGVWALMRGINRAGGGGKMPFIKARSQSILFTLGFLAVLALTIAFIAIDRWLMMLSVVCAIFLLLFALYTLTPGSTAKPARAAWTAALAAGGWLAVSKGFEVYMRYFARYDALYGSIGVFLGLMLWVFFICIVIILGAELGSV